MELPIGAIGVFSRGNNEAPGRPGCRGVQKAGGRRVHKVVQARAANPLERPEACQRVAPRVRGCNRKFRGVD